MLLAHEPDADAAAPTTTRPVSKSEQVRAWMRGPLTAVQFLTILPLTTHRTTRPHELGPAEAFFPLAGLLIGGVLLGADRLLGSVAGGAVTNVLLVAAAAAITGALHLDGVIDTFDGLFAPGGSERRLQIMRDPRAGSFGVIAVTLLLALKVAALGSLTDGARTAGLLLGPCVGRCTIVMITSVFPYARPQGSGRAFKDAVRPVHAVVAGAMTLAAAFLAAGWAGIATVCTIALIALLLGRWCCGRLGGLSGDTYGAACELAETTTWLALGLHLSQASPGGMFG